MKKARHAGFFFVCAPCPIIRNAAFTLGYT